LCEFFQEDILLWFSKHYRSFPWRRYSDPYRIMIAEFMLHRTRAAQVVPVYEEFLEKYPDVRTLAGADENEIKEVTRHLGLHWRSGHFIAAAQFVLEEFGGEFPDNRKELLKIPGVGDYVAGAILTVCFNKPEHVIDSNIARFIDRFHGLGLKGELRRKRKIIDLSKDLFNISEPGTFLFAILDFTDKICKPRTPECNQCILNRDCRFPFKNI
jgi:A/G-specific adenine glycosylase